MGETGQPGQFFADKFPINYYLIRECPGESSPYTVPSAAKLIFAAIANAISLAEDPDDA
jgi:hypothetical protein